MTRKKVKLAYISNESARKATFKKRKKGLMKKVSELSTLCDIDACAIIYSPYETSPEVFPSVAGVHRVLAKFRKMPEMEQSKKMVNQEGFLRQRIAKANDQLKKQRKENREKEITALMFQALTAAAGARNRGGGLLHGLSVLDLNDLGWLIDQTLKDIHKQMEALSRRNNNKSSISSASSTAASNHINVVNSKRVRVAAADGTPRRGGGGESNAAAAAAAAERGGFEMNVEHGMQRQQQHQQWFVDLMNQQDQQMGFGGEEQMILPFGETLNHWSNGFFP